MIAGLTKEHLTPTWPHVAYYFGVLAIFSVVLAVRFPGFKRDLIRRGSKNEVRVALIAMLLFYGLFVGYGIALIVRTASP